MEPIFDPKDLSLDDAASLLDVAFASDVPAVKDALMHLIIMARMAHQDLEPAQMRFTNLIDSLASAEDEIEMMNSERKKMSLINTRGWKSMISQDEDNYE